MENALGLIEIRGLASAIMVSDVMVKTANVKIINIERAKGSGWMTVKISGNVAAVIASINAGKQVGMAYGHYISSKVIPRPAAEVSDIFCKPGNLDEPPTTAILSSEPETVSATENLTEDIAKIHPTTQTEVENITSAENKADLEENQTKTSTSNRKKSKKTSQDQEALPTTEKAPSKTKKT